MDRFAEVIAARTLNELYILLDIGFLLVLLGAFVVTSDRPAKGKSILPDKDHSGKV